MHLCCIACEVFYRELCALAARSPNRVDLHFLPKGLHDLETGEMRARLQAAVDQAEEGPCEKILLAYALCNNGLAGVTARRKPLIVPRAHDCITLFLGSSDRFTAYFKEKPGTYFLTSGWIERGEVSGDLKEFSVQRRTGLDLSFEQLRLRYGEENARYLAERLSGGLRYYKRFTYIDTGTDPGGIFEQQARRAAAERTWEFEKIQGDLTLLEELLNGPWAEERFIIVRPGWALVPSYDSGILKAVPAGEVPADFRS